MFQIYSMQVFYFSYISIKFQMVPTYIFFLIKFSPLFPVILTINAILHPNDVTKYLGHHFKGDLFYTFTLRIRNYSKFLEFVVESVTLVSRIIERNNSQNSILFPFSLGHWFSEYENRCLSTFETAFYSFSIGFKFCLSDEAIIVLHFQDGIKGQITQVTWKM